MEAELAALDSPNSWFCSPLRFPYSPVALLSCGKMAASSLSACPLFSSDVITLGPGSHWLIQATSLLNNHYGGEGRIRWLAKARGICPSLEHKVSGPTPSWGTESGKGASPKERSGSNMNKRKKTPDGQNPQLSAYLPDKPPYSPIFTGIGQFSNNKSVFQGKKLSYHEDTHILCLD